MSEEVWRELGEADPDWAVLTEAARRGRGWEHDLESFYATGERDVEAVLRGLTAAPRVAVDYGCGTGRLSFALARRGIRVVSVDVSYGMLDTLARRAKERGLAVRPVHVDDLRPSGDADLVLSLLVLQHLPSRSAVLAALKAMAGCLATGGTLVVDIPVRATTARARLQPRWHAYRLMRQLGVRPGTLHARGLSGISMLTLPSAVVVAHLEALGLEVLRADLVTRPGHDHVHYVARRSATQQARPRA